MAKILSAWCKQVKCELINRDMPVKELAELAGLTREYTSAVVNGRIYSEPAMKAINGVLDIKEPACSLDA